MENKKDFGQPSKEAWKMALEFVKNTVIPRILAEIQKEAELRKDKEKQ
jgi:hypothetical protein